MIQLLLNWEIAMTTNSFNKSAAPRKKISLLSALGIAARLAVLTTPIWAIPFINVAKSSTIIFSSGFESGFSEWDKEACCDYSIQSVSSPVRKGNKAVKFTVNEDDPLVNNRTRSELKSDDIAPNSEQWYSFSVFIPSDYKQDADAENIAQWPSRPDTNLGEKWRKQPLVLLTKKGKLYLERRWDPNPKTGTAKDKNALGPGGGEEKIDLGSYPTGKWMDFVFHAKWSYKSDGFLEVWKDGKLVVSKKGPNTYNDKHGMFFKFGMYKPLWDSVNKRVIYYDEVKIGSASATYKDMAP